MNIKFVIAILLLTSSSLSQAYCSQTRNELEGLLGLDSTDGTIYTTVTKSNNECSCGDARFSPTFTPHTQEALSILLSAKLAGKTVRIDFEDPANCRSAARVYLED
ncbi:hypothetical protein MAH1_09410 [Sessilibacter sp. MAH1]